MKRLILPIAILLSGCGSGIDWFPAPTENPAPAETASEKPVGDFILSARTGPGEFTTTTTKGVFGTYTSLAVPAQSPVTLETHTDAQTSLVIGKTLKSMGKIILVKEVVALQETP